MRKQPTRKILSIVLGLSLSLWCAPFAWADAAAPSSQELDKASADASTAGAADAEDALGEGQEAGAVLDAEGKSEVLPSTQDDEAEKESSKAEGETEGGRLSAEEMKLAMVHIQSFRRCLARLLLMLMALRR